MENLFDLTKGELNRLHFILFKLVISVSSMLLAVTPKTEVWFIVVGIIFLTYLDCDVIIKRARQISDNPYSFVILPLISGLLSLLYNVKIFPDGSAVRLFNACAFVVFLRLITEKGKEK